MPMCNVDLCACKCVCVSNIDLVATRHTDLRENCQRNLEILWTKDYVVH